MNYDEVFSSLGKVNDLISDLRFAVQMAEDQGGDPRDAISKYTNRDPNLLGAVLNLAALLNP